MKRYVYMVLVWGGVTTAPLQAQTDTTLIRTVVVENEYNPSIMDANKINVLPHVEEPAVSKKEIEYARTGRPFGAFSLYPMQNLASAPQQAEASRGWVNLGYGNYGNLLGNINYLSRLGEKDNLHLSADFNGLNGKLPLTDSDEKWTSRYYHAQVNGLYTHRFGQAELSIKGGIGWQTFNYRPYTGQLSDKQNHTLGELGAYIRSLYPDRNWQYNGELEFRYFGQSYLYYPSLSGDGNSETNIRAAIATSYRVTEKDKLGIKIEINHFGYSQDEAIYNSTTGLTPFENSTLFRFNPYYALEKEDLRLRLGIQVDWNTGFDSGIKLAPDVLAEFPFSDRYLFYVQGTGGVLTSDFRRMNRLSPYWMAMTQLKNTHQQLDITVGFRAGVAQGASLHLFGGYELRDNDLLVSANSPSPNYLTQGKANSLKIGLSGKYVYKDWIDLSAQASYHGWSTDSDLKTYLYTKPAFDFRLNALGKIEKLSWEAGYRYTSRYKGEMDAINNLHLKLSYPLLENISVWAKADNLFNRPYQYYWGYPAEKINFMLGAFLLF